MLRAILVLVVSSSSAAPTARVPRPGPQDAPPDASAAVEKEELRLPDGWRVLRTYRGAGEGDNFGIGVGSLGDVDGDGRPEILVGAARGKGWPGEEIGYVDVLSLDGRRTYRLEGEEESRGSIRGGDRFGIDVFPVADVTKDGIGDFFVLGNGKDDQDYLKLFSGADGHVLFRLDGRLDQAVPIDDRDGDGVPDFATAAAGWSSRLHSGASGRELEKFADLEVLASTEDSDGDGSGDLLAFQDRSFDDPRRHIQLVTGDGQRRRLWSSDSSEARTFYMATVAGDADGDGYVDVALVWLPAGRTNQRFPAEELVYEIELRSGRDGSELAAWREELSSPGALFLVRGIGDLDGDGRDELLVATNHAEPPWRSRVRIYSGRESTPLCTLLGRDETFGMSAAGLGDVTGDGRAELLIGAWDESIGGSVYLLSPP